jgi:hypothetical protein
MESMNRSRSIERLGVAALLIVLAAFTWRGLFLFYSGDDMMNTYLAWTGNHKALFPAQFLVWIPAYRPLGAAIYLGLYAMFGFDPTALYILNWALLMGNAVLAYRFFREVANTQMEGLLALSLILIHGNFFLLYINAGTIYDRLWFTFTAIGLTLYIRTRKSKPSISVWRAILIWLCCAFAMDSKEGGLALPALLAGYECVYVLPNAWESRSVRAWFRTVAPVHSVLLLTTVAFIMGRVYRTPSLTATAYRPHLSLATGLPTLAKYLKLLTYDGVPFSAVGAGITVALMLLLAFLLRNRAMTFGLIIFLACLAPLLSIPAREGYALYVPSLGLGLYFAALIGELIRRVSPAEERTRRSVEVSVTATVAALILLWHGRHFPKFPNAKDSAYYRMPVQFRQDYPHLPAGSKILFVNDNFGPDTYDPLFILRLLYRDRTMEVRRLAAYPDQAPPKDRPWSFDHVFALAGGRYEELDPSNIDESVRLHILRYYTVGRKVAFGNRDHGAYVISGVMDYEGFDTGRWTEPDAKLKFETAPADYQFSADFYVPEYVAAPPAKTLSVIVNGTQIGSASLSEKDDRHVSFPVKASLISPKGFTIVELKVDNPYIGMDGTRFGVVLKRAGFEYTK